MDIITVVILQDMLVSCFSRGLSLRQHGTWRSYVCGFALCERKTANIKIIKYRSAEG